MTRLKICDGCKKAARTDEITCGTCSATSFTWIDENEPIPTYTAVKSQPLNSVATKNTEKKSVNKIENLESSTDQLLREVIRASNRTTHAVRAFVRFLFIQLSSTTAAFFVLNLASRVNNSFLEFLALGIWIAGVVWSSSVGWAELAKSDVESGRF